MLTIKVDGLYYITPRTIAEFIPFVESEVSCRYNTARDTRDVIKKLLRLGNAQRFGAVDDFLYRYAFGRYQPVYVRGVRLYYTGSARKQMEAEIEQIFKTLRFGMELETGLSSAEASRFEYLNEFYVDGSCGAEFPTPAFSDFGKFYDHVKTLRDAILSDYGYGVFNPRRGAGGHFNVSSEGFKRNKLNVEVVTRAFVPLLVYLFQKAWTKRRNPSFRAMPRYRYMPTEVYDKYNFLHMKSYAWEFRFPDSIYNMDAYMTEVLTIIGLYVMARAGKPVSRILLQYEPGLLYKMLIGTVEENIRRRELLKLYLEKAPTELLKYLKEYFVLVQREWGIDLESRIENYIRRPKYND